MFLRAYLLCLLLFSVSVQANNLDLFSDPEFLPVEQAFPYQIEMQPTNIAMHFNTPDGYYLYKHRIFLTQNGTTYQPSDYSQTGKQKDDENFGQVTAFYHALSVRFERSKLQGKTATLHYQGCADAGLCYAPQQITVNLSELPVAKAQPATKDNLSTPPKKEAQNKSTQPQDSWFAKRSILQIIALFFIAGLALTFTPCVLPMVPILTSVVLGQNQRSAKQGFILSSLYVLGMAITFAIAGLSVGLLGAGANIQALMQTPWVLIVFSLLFVLLALSMFGLYELSLPNNINQKLNRLNNQQQGGKSISVFIMGALSALVVSPCVSAPLAGALIYLSTTGDALLGGLALLALGLGMGTPLIILGTTGASVLPKAGAWMDEVKHLFGILLLGVAIWLLARILPASFSLLLWGLLALFYAVHLGALEAANSASKRLIKACGLTLLLYAICALIGFFQGNTNPIMPLANNQLETPQNNNDTSQHKLLTFSDPSELNALIATSSKPIMVDVYADWCISCKEMERKVLSNPKVTAKLAHYQWVKMDITQQTKAQVNWLKQQQLFGPPSFLFFANGQEIDASRIIGEQSLDAFLTKLAQFM